MDGRAKRYDPSFKAQMVHEVVETGRGLTTVASEVGISRGTLAVWVARECETKHRSTVPASSTARGEPADDSTPVVGRCS